MSTGQVQSVSTQTIGGRKQWLVTRGARKCYVLRRDSQTWDYGCGFASDVTLRRAGTVATKRLAFSHIDAHLTGAA
jgi:hypothetical protein